MQPTSPWATPAPKKPMHPAAIVAITLGVIAALLIGLFVARALLATNVSNSYDKVNDELDSDTDEPLTMDDCTKAFLDGQLTTRGLNDCMNAVGD